MGVNSCHVQHGLLLDHARCMTKMHAIHSLQSTQLAAGEVQIVSAVQLDRLSISMCWQETQCGTLEGLT